MSVHTQCTWAWYWLSGRTYTIYIYYGDKHTNAHEGIEISPLNLSGGGSLHSPINIKHIHHIIVCILKLILKAHTTKQRITMLTSTTILFMRD